jgi:hypothetical protein
MEKGEKMKKLICFISIIFIIIITKPINAQYDYLIITPDIFLQNAAWDEKLITLQRLRGFHPVIENVTEHTTAEQIKEIIKTYYDHNSLKYVLIMGNAKNVLASGDTTIPAGYLNLGINNPMVDYANGNYIPFFSVWCNNPHDPRGKSDVPSDDNYVSDLQNRGSVYIGRVPVTTIEEAEIYTDKLYSYYQSLTIYSETRNREIFLNLDVDRTCCTGALVRSIMNKVKEEHIPSSISISELNVSEHNYCVPDLLTWQYCPQRKPIFEETLNEGASIITILATSGGPVSFGGWYWACDNRETHTGPELDFNLTNKKTGLPFQVGTNNQQGNVNHPTQECTMRKLMVYKDGGIIGAIAATHETEQHLNGKILYRFHDLVYQEDQISYGEIFKTLKEELSNGSSWYEVLNTGLTYFGDPSLVPSIYREGSNNTALKDYIFLGNYPNPFNASTNISYILRYQSSVEMIIYDIMGAKVKSFVIPSQSSGYQKIVWDGRNENGNLVSSGAYIYRVVAKSLENNESFTKTSKLMMIK